MKHFSHNIPQNAKLSIVVALSCEARPLLDYYQLKKIQAAAPFTVFCNQAESIYLIVSGIGRLKSACAVTWLHSLMGAHDHSCYLNVGIAGSQQQAIGDAILIHKMTEQVTGKSWYPHCHSAIDLKQDELVSVDKVTADYPKQGLIDMEATGFFQAASMLVNQEQAQVIKIVSDQDAASQKAVKPAFVIARVADQLEAIHRVVDQLLTLSASEQALVMQIDLVQQFIERWHFSVYQRHQLHELLRRWQIHLGDQNAYGHCQKANNVAEVFGVLNHQLSQAVYDWQ